MQNFLDLLRYYDFNIFYKLYYLGLGNSSYAHFYYFMARYGIVFFFLSFIYLIWKRKIKAFLCTLFAMGVAGLADFLVYIFWQRPRPFVTYAHLVNPNTKGMYVDAVSFPSSHTYIIFAIATSVFLYGHKKLGSFLFCLALLVAIGRVGAGLHYPSDTIGGAMLGVLSGILVYILVRKWEHKRELNPELAK